MLNNRSDYWNFNTARLWDVNGIEVDAPPVLIRGQILPIRMIGNYPGSVWIFFAEDYAFLNELIAERFVIPSYIDLYGENNQQALVDATEHFSVNLLNYGPYSMRQNIQFYQSIYTLLMNFVYDSMMTFDLAGLPDNGVSINWQFQFPGENLWPVNDTNLPPQGSTTKNDYGGTQTFVKIDPNPVIQSAYTQITPVSYENMIRNQYPQSLYTWLPNNQPPLPSGYVRRLYDIGTMYYNLRATERYIQCPNAKVYFDCEWDYYKQDPQAAQSQTAGVFYRPIKYEEYHYKANDVQPNLGLISGTLSQGFNKTNGDLPGNTVYRIQSICGNTYPDPAMDYKYPWFVVEDKLNNDFAFMYPELRLPVNQCTCVCHYVIYHFKSRISIYGGGYSNGTYQKVDVFFPLKPIEFEDRLVNTNLRHRMCRCISNVYKTQTEYERGLPRGGDMGLCIDWKQWLGQNGYTFLTQNVANVDTSDASQPYYDIHSSYGRNVSESDATNRNEIIWVDLASVDIIYRFNGRTKLRNIQWNWTP